MESFAKDFGPFEGKIWLNASGQGPMPHAAAESLKEAVEWKTKPYHLTISKFVSASQQLKNSLSRLIQVSSEDIILGNSATYGLHLLANGFPFEQGDEVLCMFNDFPSDILPWLGLSDKGVRVRQVKPSGLVLTPEEVESAVTARTKVVCLSWVHSFSGHKIDAHAIGRICQKRGIVFILNCTQILGTCPISVKDLPVDAVTCAGYKWLLGPYGTGFCWIRKDLRARLKYNQAYWSSALSQEDLERSEEVALKEIDSARKYDVFATANFFNFIPWKTCVDYLLNISLERVQTHNKAWVDEFIDRLDTRYQLISPKRQDQRTNIIVFSHQNPGRNPEIFSALKELGIYAGFWKGNIRISPHLHNTPEELSHVVSVFASLLN